MLEHLILSHLLLTASQSPLYNRTMSNIQNEIIMENIFDEILGDMEQKFPFMNESEITRKAIELAEKQFEDTIPY